MQAEYISKRSIHQNDLDKAYFQHDMTYSSCKVLVKRTKSDKSFKIASDPKYNGYGRGLVSIFYKFFDKKSSGSGAKSTPNH